VSAERNARVEGAPAPLPPPRIDAAGLRVDELLLRPPTPDDVDALAPAFADPAVGGEAGLPPFDAATLREMIVERLPAMAASGLLVPLVVAEADTGRVVGGASYHHFSFMREAIEIGYWLYPEARGRGVATRTVRTLAVHAFAGGVYRVNAVVRIGNVASERVLERAGFTREGVARRLLLHEGVRRDATLFALLADDPGG
jgi:RimJ/RimL family protein N-acetyltransferase